MRKWLSHIILLIGSLLYGLSATAQSLSPLAHISLLTCTPGDELYTRYGHTALRVVDPLQRIDWVFNYGMFSFEDSHFYLHFVQGQTWYELGMQTYSEFIPEYHYFHRPVAEQVLNLTNQEMNALFRALIINAQPDNCKYLYNFVFDNCATRPYYILKDVLGDSLVSDYQGWEGRSYRDFIHHYTRHGSWAEFGIDLVFGYKADRPVNGEGRLFLPEELMFFLSQAHLSDGRPLVKSENLTPFAIKPVAWYQTWYFGVALFAVLMIWLNWYDCRRGKRTKWVDYTLYSLYALLAALMIFLIFFSVHPLVSIGWRLFLIPFIHLCTRYIYIWH
ncbi:MAG: DUF4105 domain-containing protein [Paludibacteraceae bacterium]|nr:DUF4105 domain-containing protein [Paludibacteraceae bacterium]